MKHVAVIGSGPAGLMVADVLSEHGFGVTVFERRNGPARKLFIAGGSGLNISNSLDPEAFRSHYTPAEFFRKSLEIFNVDSWLSFIHALGLTTFLGTSGRYFTHGMNAMPLVRAWRKRLQERGVKFVFNSDCNTFSKTEQVIRLGFEGQGSQEFDAVVFALGGASYEDSLPKWPKMFAENNIRVEEFTASNVGFNVEWSEGLLREAEGHPLKDVVLKTIRGEKRGDIVITKYGIEGTPVYFLGVPGGASIDLKPTFQADELYAKCQDVKENLSPLRRVQARLNLCPAALALLYHETPDAIKNDLSKLVQRIKSFPIQMKDPQPIAEAISSRGGVALDEVDDDLMLKKIPGVFIVGEMLNWDAPTGGFLIQGCVSQAVLAGKAIIRFFEDA